MIVTPILVTFGSLIEFGLAVVFHMLRHPWVSVLKKERPNREDDIMLKKVGGESTILLKISNQRKVLNL